MGIVALRRPSPVPACLLFPSKLFLWAAASVAVQVCCCQCWSRTLCPCLRFPLWPPQPQPPLHCGILPYTWPRWALSCNESAHSLHQDPPSVMFYRTSNLKLRAYLIFLIQVQTFALLIFNWPFLGGYWWGRRLALHLHASPTGPPAEPPFQQVLVELSLALPTFFFLQSLSPDWGHWRGGRQTLWSYQFLMLNTIVSSYLSLVERDLMCGRSHTLKLSPLIPSFRPVPSQNPAHTQWPP